MKSILTFILATFLLFPLQAQEKVYTVDNLPKVHLQNKMQYVCNPAGILSQAACDSIDSMLYALEQQTGIETVVAVVPSIGEEDCFDFCHQLLNKWGVGKKGKNNGLVILLVTDQRCIQFYTGYGLEGVLPDAICKRIQTRYMIPYLKDGNWDAGMVAGLKATCQRLDGSMENDALSDSNDGGSFDFILAILCFIAIGGGLAFFSARKQSRCPNCGKHQLQRSGSRVVSRINGVKTEDVTYTCRNCGHTIIRRQQTNHNHYQHPGGGAGRLLHGGDAAVHRDDEAHPLAPEGGHRLPVEAVALLHPVGDIGDHRPPLPAEEVGEQAGGGDAVHVVVAVDRDVFPRRQRPAHPRRGPVHVLHEKRVQELAPAGVQKGAGLLRGVQPAGAEGQRRQGRHPRRLHGGPRLRGTGRPVPLLVFHGRMPPSLKITLYYIKLSAL